MWRATRVLLCLLAACGGDDGGDGDAYEFPDDERPACPDQVNAGFSLQTSERGVYAGGFYEDRPKRAMLSAMDGCTRWEDYVDDGPRRCEPACDGDDVCIEGDDGNVCTRRATNLNVGVVHFTGTDPAVKLSPHEDNSYFDLVSLVPVYQPGDAITVRGGGGDTGVEPFAITSFGVPELTVPWRFLSGSYGEDLEVTWDVADSPVGTRVSLTMVKEYVDATERVVCWSDDTGQMTVPAGYLIDDSSHLYRVQLATVETEHGCAVFEIRYQLEIEIRAE